MDQIKYNIKAVVGSSKYGIPLYSLENEYKNITNSTLNYRSFNYPDLKSFLESISDVVRLKQNNNCWFVYLVTTEDDPQCLMNLRNLIQHTKIKKGSKGNPNIPQNIIGRPNSTNLKISVPNDLRNYGRSHYQNFSNCDNQRNNSNLKPSSSMSSFKNTNNFSRHNGSNGNSTVSKQPISASQSNQPIKQGFSTNVNSSSLAANNHIENGTSVVPVKTAFPQWKPEIDPVSLGDDQNKLSEPSINWPIHMVIDVHVLHKRVKILGIHGGYALVTVLDSMQPSFYIECKLFDTGTPGDFLLWQPPISDSNRTKTAVDTSSAFPVILIGRLSATMLQVRLLGLRILLEVDIGNVFEYPRNSSEATRFMEAFRCREATLVNMAAIGPFVNIWDCPALSGVYYAPICLDDDKFIFERCENRGHFLNVILLVFYTSNMISKLVTSKKQMFIGNLISLLDSATTAFRCHVNDMLANRDRLVNRESDILLPVLDRSDCENQMLIGCLNFIDGNSRRSRADIGDLALYRIVYSNQNGGTFSHFDSNSSQVSANWSDVPIPGIYVLNERFVNCRLSQMAKLRFQAAMLLHIPDFNTLRKI